MWRKVQLAEAESSQRRGFRMTLALHAHMINGRPNAIIYPYQYWVFMALYDHLEGRSLFVWIPSSFRDATMLYITCVQKCLTYTKVTPW